MWVPGPSWPGIRLIGAYSVEMGQSWAIRLRIQRPRNFWLIVTVNRMRVVCNHPMRLRLLLFLLLFLNAARTGFAGDVVTVKINHFGLEGNYASPAEPTWVEVSAHNNENGHAVFQLVVSEVNLENDALPITEVVTVPAELTASETRVFDVPLHIVPQNHAVLYVQALSVEGHLLGRTGIVVGQKMNGQIIAMLCATADLCRAIRQSILLSGGPEEQTRKSSSLRLIQLTKPAPAGWAYSSADILILAMPMAQFSAAQRDALEIYLHRGGSLVLVDDQLLDSSPAEQPRFLDAYRRRAEEGRALSVGDGQFIRLKSVSSRSFSDHFRGLGVAPSTPEELRELVGRLQIGGVAGDPNQVNPWLMRRLGTTFRFPGFFEMLSWIIGYLVLTGVVNFIVLRRIGRPELGWITTPVLAVLFSVLLYAVSARNHPSNFGVDEMTVYRLDSLSPLAVTTSRVRISAPVRSTVTPVLPGNVVEGPGRRSPFPFGFASGASQSPSEVFLNTTWETSFPLRRWSFSDLEFEGQRRFAGTVQRDNLGRIHNETGLNYRQAMIVDERDVFFLGELPAGAVVDLTHVSHQPYEEETGRRTSDAVANFPGIPFPHKAIEKEQWFGEEWTKRSDKEYADLSKQPFALSELIRGWPKDAKAVFSTTKAVFFGLSNEATLGATLRDRSPDRKAATLTMIAFEEWP